MHCINVWLTVKSPDDISAVRDLLAECQRLSRQEPGCERFEVYHSDADTSRFLLCEHWTDRSDWETHREARAFSEFYQPRVLPLVDREAHICTPVD